MAKELKFTIPLDYNTDNIKLESYPQAKADMEALQAFIDEVCETEASLQAELDELKEITAGNVEAASVSELLEQTGQAFGEGKKTVEQLEALLQATKKFKKNGSVALFNKAAASFEEVCSEEQQYFREYPKYICILNISETNAVRNELLRYTYWIKSAYAKCIEKAGFTRWDNTAPNGEYVTDTILYGAEMPHINEWDVKSRLEGILEDNSGYTFL